MRRTLLATILFFLLLLSGGIWISLARYVPDGIVRSIFIPAVGVLFAAIFLTLLIVRLRVLLVSEESMLSDIVLGIVEFALFILAFAWVHTELGLVDKTLPGQPLIHSFPTSIFFTVVNFTNLGANELQAPVDGRFLVALEAFIGYLLLGILASSFFALLVSRRPIWIRPPHNRPEE